MQYKIGEFAKKVDLPVRTVRYYTEIGLIKPSVDRFSNYHYYDENNAKECSYIMLLKSMGFTLDEIIVNKNGITPEMLLKKENELRDLKKSIEKRLELIRVYMEHEKVEHHKVKNLNNGKRLN